MHACQRCTLYVHMHVRDEHRMYMCMSEVHTVCTCACQRCTLYVHMHVRDEHRMYIYMSEVHTVCTCACQRCTPHVHMHVRGAHRTYMHACQRCTSYVHMHVRGAHRTYRHSFQRCGAAGYETGVWRSFSPDSKWKIYTTCAFYPLETMLALTPYTLLPCCFPLSQFPVSIKGDPKCRCRKADNMPTLQSAGFVWLF